MIWHHYISERTQVTCLIFSMHCVDYDTAGTKICKIGRAISCRDNHVINAIALAVPSEAQSVQTWPTKVVQRFHAGQFACAGIFLLTGNLPNVWTY